MSPDRKEIWTIGRILKWTEQYFGGKGVESPRLEAEVLLSHVLQKQRIYLYVHFEQPLEQEELSAYRELIKKRAAHVPTAYLLGKKEFMGLDFKVSPAVLVPRPDTEILVQAAVERLRLMEAPVRFADIGTGSGAICLSVLNFVPEAVAETVDISPEARKVAEENAGALGLAGRVTFRTGDLLDPLTGRFAAILSNPPYIPEKDMKSLQAEVRLAEPHTALCGGRDGLDFYRRLCAAGPELLTENGFMAFEVGLGQAPSVAAMAMEHPQIGRTETLKDLAGIERVVIAYRKQA